MKQGYYSYISAGSVFFNLSKQMVDIEFIPVDGRVVVRFKREFASQYLPASYMATELIITIADDRLEDLKSDYAAYTQLSVADQQAVIEQLRGVNRYTGRLVPDPVIAANEASELPQPVLF